MLGVFREGGEKAEKILREVRGKSREGREKERGVEWESERRRKRDGRMDVSKRGRKRERRKGRDKQRQRKR